MRLERYETDTPIGDVTMVFRGDALCALGFADCWPRLHAALERRFGTVDIRPGADGASVTGRLRAYFGGDLEALAPLAIDPGGTAFQRRVWDGLRRIPSGHTASYRDLARRIDRPAAVRAVGAASGANPIWIVIPCHRLIGTGGALTGYAGGLHRKQWLLAHEGAIP
jgi:methylated-DNA-[protein]-cysteine S-methyltransferase